MNISPPYLLFLGDATDPLSIKMAKSAADWSPEKCIGECKEPSCTVTTGLQNMTIADAAEAGAKSFVLGFANSGGHLDSRWIPTVIEALAAGLDIINGLHDKLEDIPEIKDAAEKYKCQLIDIRHPKDKFKTGKGYKRQGKRLLTVGTDCSVGKMYTSLSIARALQAQGKTASFRATGQSGILVSGAGVAVDCVISDFIAGAVEALSPAIDDANAWDIIEGQGSLSHPAFAGVSLGLLHGAQPDAIVVCHALNRHHMRGLPDCPQPSIEQTITMNELMAKITNKHAKVIGVSVNTSAVSEQQAIDECKAISERVGLPCIDPVRHGVDALLSVLDQM